MTNDTSTERTLTTVEINGCHINIVHGRDADGCHYLQLQAVDCNLEGEEPGLYYPTPA